MASFGSTAFSTGAFSTDAFSFDVTAVATTTPTVQVGGGLPLSRTLRQPDVLPAIIILGRMSVTEEGQDIFSASGSVEESDKQVNERRNARVLQILLLSS